MVSHPDEYYRDKPPAMTETLLRSGYYLRPLNAVDELALCMASRGWVLEANRRYAEAAWAFAQACRLAAAEPMYPRAAACCVGRWMRESFNAGRPKHRRISCDGMYQIQDLYMDPRKLLRPEHVSLALSVQGRYFQILGKSNAASRLFGEARRWLPGNTIRPHGLDAPVLLASAGDDVHGSRAPSGISNPL
jgi:hypothetical protein